jgi:hypothetical protein
MSLIDHTDTQTTHVVVQQQQLHPSIHRQKKGSQDPITPHGSLSVTTTINQNPNSIDLCYTITPFVFVWGREKVPVVKSEGC